MDFLTLIFWAVIVIASLVWYAALLFTIGARAGREVLAMRERLSQRAGQAPPPTPPSILH
jgi:hypothetical protein